MGPTMAAKKQSVRRPESATVHVSENSAPKPRPTEEILAFSSAADWDKWLAANHDSSPAVYLRIPKGSGRAFGYADALDAALVWGWIDSQKRALDEAFFLQRFGPRTSKSPWSKINRGKIEFLISAGRMQAPGLAEVARAKADGRWEQAYDGARTSSVPEDLAAAFAMNAKARAFFETLDGANRYAILWRVQTAKKAVTRSARIEKFVAMCSRGERIHPLEDKV